MRRRGLAGLAVVGATLIAAGGIVAGAAGDDDRAEISNEVTQQYPVLSSPQGDEDRVSASTPASAASAHEQSRTSRLIARSDAGNAYAFVSSKGEVCVLFQDAARTLGASGCAGSGGRPSVLVYREGDAQSATVASVVGAGASRVEVRRPCQASDLVDARGGGFVYSGSVPFSVAWTETSGPQRMDVVVGPDVGRLKRLDDDR